MYELDIWMMFAVHFQESSGSATDVVFIALRAPFRFLVYLYHTSTAVAIFSRVV